MGDRIFSVHTTDHLMLRALPDRGSAVLARLEPGQVVARLDEEERAGWHWVFADVAGDGAYVGYVAARHVRALTGFTGPVDPPAAAAPLAEPAPLQPQPAASAFVERLIACCNEEWRRFEQGRLKEADEPARTWIREYWQALGIAERDGASNYAWSAAFISFMMRKAGAEERFKYSAGHATYINEALAQKDNPRAHFQAMRPETYAPRLGDLIARARPTSKNPAEATFDTARDIGWYTSHADIVTEIGNGRAFAIGGNVDNSVTRFGVPLTADGRIDPTYRASRKIFAILGNRL
jgi:hypothetical protein